MWEIKCFLGYFLRSFVEPVLDQLDITVLPFSLATKIVFEDETKKGGDPLKAAGIEVKKQLNLISLAYNSLKQIFISILLVVVVLTSPKMTK